MNSQIGICVHGVGTEYVKNCNYTRVQLCHKFSDAGDITDLLRMNKKHPIRISYHAPVFHQVDPTLTYYLSSNFRLREATFEILDINLRMAQSLPTDYVVVHFTSNAIADETITDYELKYLAGQSAKRISMLGKQYGLPIYLEYASYNSRFNRSEDFINVIKDYDNLGICLDIGHLYLVCQMYGLNYFDELEKLLPYTKAIHPWNTTSKQTMETHGYIPSHPSQKVEDGWIDIERTINLALDYNDSMYIVFEPNFEYKGKEYFEEGVNWVNDIVNKHKSYKGEVL